MNMFHSPKEVPELNISTDMTSYRCHHRPRARGHTCHVSVLTRVTQPRMCDNGDKGPVTRGLSPDIL